MHFKIPGFYKLQRTHETERIPHHFAQVGKEGPPVEALEPTPPTQGHQESKMIYLGMLCYFSGGHLSLQMYYCRFLCAFLSWQDRLKWQSTQRCKTTIRWFNFWQLGKQRTKVNELQLRYEENYHGRRVSICNQCF